VTAAIVFGVLQCVSGECVAETRRVPRPTPTPDHVVEHIEAIEQRLRQIRTVLDAAQSEVANLGSRLDALAASVAEVKGIVEPMREEVRGLYVESSNVRGEIARLDQSSMAYTESLGRSRYVLTLLLVATAVLQLIVLAVLMRKR
jgi:septal ring factor EnvC (AmiA/AmiB activator)